MNKSIAMPPLLYPIFYFGLTISIGAILLHSSLSHQGSLTWIDAVFTATSATCVTGLTVVDIGTFFNLFGQSVILALIQLGGIGIMTFTGLIFYLWRHHVSFTDRVAVGSSLLHDPSFALGRFLVRIVLWTLSIEAVGALLLHFLAPTVFPAYEAVFHAVSAFCNAGFALRPDSLSTVAGRVGLNLVFMLLIISGGLGFSLLVELGQYSRSFILASCRKQTNSIKLSWHTRIVLITSALLIVIGWLVIYGAEFIGFNRTLPFGMSVLTALFQSVTCRTAGFNTLNISQMTNVSLVIMIFLMFIGGAPGSCAGGVKVTTLAAVLAFIKAQLLGRQQTTIGRYAVSGETVTRALILLVFSVLIIFGATLLLNMTEGGDLPHPQARGLYLEILFETVSAFGTVGLSMGLTAKLTMAGKCIITLIMFIGRLGPILFLTVVQALQKNVFFNRPEENLLIG
jgi:trk system potassium uptake protein TrkH